MANGNPSSWVNLQDYLGLNQDQGSQMAADVYGNVEGKTTKVGTQLSGDVNSYNEAVQAGTVQPGSSKQQYSGPTDLASYDPSLEGNVSDAVQQMQLTADPNTRGQVLQETYGSKGADTTGGAAFDSFLASASPGGEQLDAFGPKYKDLQNALGLDEQNAYDAAQGAMATSATNATANANKPASTTPTDQSWHPGDYKTLQDFMDKGSPTQYAHEAAMYASPADWVTRGLGELGYNGENASQLFAGRFGVSGNTDLTWNTSNLRQAARLVQDQYGDKALNDWYTHLTPDAWKSYMDLGNAGAQARQMRAWLEANGHKRNM